MLSLRSTVWFLIVDVLLLLPRPAVSQATSPQGDSDTLLPPLVVLGPDLRVLVAFPNHAPPPSDRGIPNLARPACADVIVPPMAAVDSGLVGTIERDQHDVVVVVAPGEARFADCESRWDARAAAIWRGLALRALDSARAAPQRVALVINGDTIAPLATVRHPAHRLVDGRWVVSGMTVASRFPGSAFAVRDDWPSVSIVVWLPSGTYIQVEVPRTERRLLATEYAATTLNDSSTSPERPLHLSLTHPVSPVIARAVADAGEGSVTSAGLASARWLARTDPSAQTSHSSAVAHLLIAEAFARRGDGGTARRFALEAARDRPCILEPERTSIDLRRLLSTETPGAACRIVAPDAVLMAGLRFPGGGHRALAESRTGAMVTALTAAVFGTSILQLRHANDSFAEYAAASDPLRLDAMYATANQQRSRARTVLAGSAVIWSGDAIVTWFLARHHNKQVLDDRP